MSNVTYPAENSLGAHGLTPETVSLLRRHNLLLPLVRGLVEDALVGESPLPEQDHQTLMSQWAGGEEWQSALEQAKQKSGLYPDDVIWQVERPTRLARCAKDRFSAKAEARFLQRKRDLDLVSYSLVRVKDGNFARELYLRLAAGEATFAELASQYSDGPERQTNGVIGPKPVSAAHPQLAERLRTARDGEVMEPFCVADWWLITRRDSYQPAVLDERMAELMAQELLQDWIAEESERHLQQLFAHEASNPTPGLQTS